MENYTKIISISLISVILSLVLSKQNKDLAIILSLCACALGACAGLAYLSPVIDFFEAVSKVIQLDHNMLEILLKSAGIGLISELATLISTDAGYSAIGKVIQLSAVMVILWISLPLYEGLLNLVQKIMEGL